MLVSVIIPVYNVNPYLAEALDSVILQTHKELEIIVIDDGSTDGSAVICDEYAKKDNRFHVIHQKNNGLSFARNTGLENAKGELIAFLDPDDAYEPIMIPSMLQEMQRNGSDIAICKYSVEKTQGRMNKKYTNTNSSYNTEKIIIGKDEALLRAFNDQIDSAVWNKIYSRKIWEGLRFPDGYVYEGTYTLFDILNKAESVVIIDEKLVLHRIREGSITNSLSIKSLLDADYAREHNVSFVKDHTPNIFTYKQCKKKQFERITGLISGYIRYVHYNPNNAEGINRIKKHIKKVWNESDSCYDTFPVRMIYEFCIQFPFVAAKLYFSLLLIRRIYQIIKKYYKI